jgi:hypothetical protein
VATFLELEAIASQTQLLVMELVTEHETYGADLGCVACRADLAHVLGGEELLAKHHIPTCPLIKLIALLNASGQYKVSV